MKNRLSSIDVAAECACLKKLLGLRLTNVYDISAKTYVLKLSKSGEEGEKHLLLLESGARFHTIEAMPEKADVPSNFTLKLRKHLRTRRLEQVRQLGVDRIVDFVFGSGDAQYHLILEMYSQGNVVLTDSKFEVLSLLRSHRDDDSGYAVMARHPYPIASVRLRHVISKEELSAALVKEDNANLKAVMSSLLPFGPAVSERVVLDAGLDPGSKPGGEENEAPLLAALARLDSWFASLKEHPPEGFISFAAGSKGKPNKGAALAASTAGGGQEEKQGQAPLGVYSDFSPMRPLKGNAEELLAFATFDMAIQDFFSKIEGQRAAVARQEAEKGAMSKLDKIKQDQSGRVNALQKDADEAELKGTLIEYNLDIVDGVLDAINEALASGMDWRELDTMIKAERRAGNPVAGMIHSLQLHENQATILLSNYLDVDEGDDEALTRPATKVTVDLSLSAYANACVHYAVKKKHAAKQFKTLAANELAIKAAEKKALLQLQKVRSTPVVVAPRKPAWFEKFIWFVSSENYLVISGRDAQQNELIVKRYFRPGDAYVHAELHGASSTIVKNPNPDKQIPPMTLEQAGCACVCRSRAWDSKIVTSAWWVSHSQVSKSAPTGEYLPTGSFMIRGRKNFLPPQTLTMGFGFMFKLEEGSIASHLGERAPRLLGDPEASGEIEEDQEVEMDDEGDDEAGAGGEEGGNGLSALEQFMEGGVDILSVARSTSTSTNTASIMNIATNKVDKYAKYGLQASPLEEEGGGGGGGREEGGQGQGRQGPRQALSGQGQGGNKGGGKSQLPPASGGQKPSKEAAKAAPASALLMAASAAAVRGKKGKAAKIKDKYADQDEEDRELALQLLQSKGEKKSRSDRRKERKEKKEAKRKDGQAGVPGGLKGEDMAEAIAKATAKQFEPEAQDEEEGEETGAEDSSSDDEDHEALMADDLNSKAAALDLVDAEEKREIDALMKEEGEEGSTAILADEDREKLTVLDSFTGLPRGEDLLLSAIPVCGPYSALQQYKYKVKITPGTVKKGKAARSALELLSRGPEVTQREKDLLKQIPEQEMINCIMGNCRLAMVGLAKLKAGEKASRKAKAKAEKGGGD